MSELINDLREFERAPLRECNLYLSCQVSFLPRTIITRLRKGSDIIKNFVPLLVREILTPFVHFNKRRIFIREWEAYFIPLSWKCVEKNNIIRTTSISSTNNSLDKRQRFPTFRRPDILSFPLLELSPLESYPPLRFPPRPGRRTSRRVLHSNKKQSANARIIRFERATTWRNNHR